MAAGSKKKHKAQEKRLDISHGDVVYLRGDLGLKAGVGLVTSLERETSDIMDTIELTDVECPMIQSKVKRVVMDGVLVYWMRIQKEFWMENSDLIQLTTLVKYRGKDG